MLLYVVGIRHADLVEQLKQFKQEHSPMHRDERHADKYGLQDSLSNATKTGTQQPDMDSDPSKTCGGVAQAGPGYAPDYTVTAGAWPHIDFHRDVAVQLEATNQYGLHPCRPIYGAMRVKHTLFASLIAVTPGRHSGNRAPVVKQYHHNRNG